MTSMCLDAEDGRPNNSEPWTKPGTLNIYLLNADWTRRVRKPDKKPLKLDNTRQPHYTLQPRDI